MIQRWPDYARFPASGADFETYVATVFLDLGYSVTQTPASNDYGADLILVEPLNHKKIAVQAKFYNHSSLGNTPIQEVIGSLSHWNADEGWVVTNGRFSKNARKLAEENNIHLIDNEGLNGLIAAARDGYFAKRSIRPIPATDTSGLDVFVGEASQAPRPLRNSPNERWQNTAANNAARQSTFQAPEPKTYNMQDIMIRWNCSRGYVNKEISRGFPMRKLANGRWSVTEQDLANWESQLAEERRIEQERAKQNSIISIAISLILIIAVGALIVLMLLDSSVLGTKFA